MSREAAARTLLFFLPTLVFIIALTAPGGDYAFRTGPLGEVQPGSLPYYVAVENKTLYLYSSPYAPWLYPGALELKLFYPTKVAVFSTCGAVAAGELGGQPGAYPVDVAVPPAFQGDCWVNFTHPSGWRQAVLLRVRLVDWYPGASERAVVELNGSGWQFLQVGQDGMLYIWERPVVRLPVAGCVSVYNRSVLLTEILRYVEAAPNVVPPVYVPSEAGAARYGAFIHLEGPAKLYIYGAPCLSHKPLNATPPPPLRGRLGVVLPTPTGPVFDQAEVNNTAVFKTGLRVVNYSVAPARVYKLYLYTYSTPVGMWGAVLRYNFALTAYLTTEISLLWPEGARSVEKRGDVWAIHTGGATYWVYSRAPPRTICEPPCGVPAGWADPIYVVVDPTGRWGGWPSVLSVKREVLQPWRP
ncbi:hypothetical protein [Pyrobaculum neutrophilum]|uniref:Uncharacterized protein n=1 Tax=Pyrobaculum neutrophilum (strain DSM 2338 / JCM 9278 / NBRC 100436 / V24Sta) TaxID=444157 RepID=B1YD78_PYRNV|nr:hypothetical protein [Pyrobaculum neutrophilum]ACB39741.1 conserved hypothetical protein [Pyrobaculum neutrophilum V24Sta]